MSKVCPVLVGLYGISGCGKSSLLNDLKELGSKDMAFYEGSEAINSVVPGGLGKFQEMGEDEKTHWRELAIDQIREECSKSGRTGLVAAHYMFWSEEQQEPVRVYTERDLEVFSHVLYLDVPAEIIAQRRSTDPVKTRHPLSSSHLGKWQAMEKFELRLLCRERGLNFLSIWPQPDLSGKTMKLLVDFSGHTEASNLVYAQKSLDDSVALATGAAETILAVDADRTLAPQDTGELFWKHLSELSTDAHQQGQLKAQFASPMGYSYASFRQVTLMYEEADEHFDTLCEKVAAKVTIYPQMLSILRTACQYTHVGAVVVTSGLRAVWQKVLDREGLSGKVKIIGGGRLADGFVVTAEVKAALVSRLRDIHHAYVWAFGDSPLDIGMLCEAQQAVVVVGSDETRSNTMDAALLDVLQSGKLKAAQAVMSNGASPRLNTSILPIIHLDDTFLDAVVQRRDRYAGFRIEHGANGNSAKLLMTPTRDASISGPPLREAHRRVGFYLATAYLSSILGVENYPIPHVQGHHTSGYRISNERGTLITALMRGGEAMAFGVNDAFPSAMFLHASQPEAVTAEHLQGIVNVILVDSVINSGRTIVEFVQHVRQMRPDVRIVVVAGVVHAKFISERNLTRHFPDSRNLSLVALRVSTNKFQGVGGTDTGNRLFNTTHLP